jgi:hypothetical protein
MADKKPFLLRLNPEVWKEIERWAAEDFRSVNGQIEFILHEAILHRRKKTRPGPNPPAAEAPPKEEL